MSRAVALQPELRALMVFDQLPAGCISFPCIDEDCMPHIRPGEFAVVDTADRRPQHGELYVIQWNGGRRCICQARISGVASKDRPIDEAWSVGSLAGIRGRDAVEAHLRALRETSAGIPSLRRLAWSEGWFTEEHLTSKLVGRVIGIHVPEFEEPKWIG